mmetsp:Transcript_6387/g.11406  ORF Transcript_6387/g.11406 Transcript_6387/m.11406 type:complete len:590 (-) Transcript_6387:168-1937(-)|eukprot:CAMPEP_0197661222 /NCGR_PEP_ID=MMETSP1338-20131121/51325_1 /TAXON_ID=43686 ORGANISM="Pelagodinium beii, Strain RCC1491" /NCGR_SAMPLE_ID=MMETSP1338 /ASSEMBLY_ACC=CAM_ASM_000754 /LENGTH=589 /DNA_ID=CAMNT_0043238737 /DNA_START=16 /DNA_END=1785 /DNA_ORIENTATION=+
MAISWSAVLTLAVVLLAGPFCWVLLSAARRMKACRSSPGNQGERVGEEADHGGCAREEVNSIEYLVTLLGYAIGIGNLWRFPYLVGKWGGGAFVLAYLCSLVLVAAPLYLIEMGMGHQTRCSALDCFNAIHPRWIGLGLSQAFMLFCVLSYFNVLIAYAFYYVAASLHSPLPWSQEASGAESLNPVLTYWQDGVLGAYTGDLSRHGLGPLQWHLAAALLVVWLIIFLSLAFGKQVLAKVTWVTVVAPVLMLTMLLVQSVTLEGAGSGIEFYIGKFDVNKLADIQLWATACSQILFSLSPGFGTAISLSSYARPKEDVVKVCIRVAFCNSAFSIVGGFAIFSILGNLALRTGKTMAEVASSGGTGLAFVAIAEGILGFGSWANAVSVFFFLTLVALGLDSTFAMAETFVSIADDYCRRKGWHTPKRRIVAAVCFIAFLLGLPYCTSLGSFLLDVVDHFVGTIFLLVACCFEALVFAFGYTWDRLAAGIKAATGRRMPPRWLYRLLLGVVVPCATGVLALQLIIANLRAPYENYPVALQVVGWVLLGVCVLLFLSTLWLSGESQLGQVVSARAEPDLHMTPVRPEREIDRV